MILFLLLILSSCNFSFNSQHFSKKSNARDLSEIQASRVLVAVTKFNSTNYFIYRGEPMGFKFDLLQAYADHLGVRLEIIAENNLDEAYNLLKDGKVDLIANSLPVTTSHSKWISFTHPVGRARQVLVQRRQSSAEEGQYISNPLELASRLVYVQRSSGAALRLRNLSEEIGAEIMLVELDRYEPDELIELVSKGEIDYTVCDEDIARVNSFYYNNIDISVPISFEQNLAWAVSNGSPELLANLNAWLETFSQTAEFRIIRNKYFDNPFWARRILSELSYIKEGRVSNFDDKFRYASQSIDWDWRLFASLVYQESRFQHDVKSHKGAYGLMQFMPATAEFFGVKHKADPDVQIAAGARYLNWLEKRFENTDIAPEERVKFILASYNAGIGHVIDARNLARKHGKNPDVWEDNVDYFILNKSKPEYYRDSVVRFGYIRGRETYNYVYQIIDRYKHYRNLLPD